MNGELAVELARHTLQTTLWIGVPILGAATVVALLISILQVMTSIQDSTVATVPRLLTVAAVTFLMMPWFLRQMVSFTVQLFRDFHPYLR
ncbi:MAG TPA: flagellar biosynthetic protein FliQ [Terriglobia bacterium]|nr:flagellar biosynthetic protein FliQ [Terriglobia bacterium]